MSLRRYDFQWWRDIRKVSEQQPYQNWFERNLCKKIRKENIVRFQENRWLGDIPLLEISLRLYVNSLKKKCLQLESGYLEWYNMKMKVRMDDTMV